MIELDLEESVQMVIFCLYRIRNMSACLSAKSFPHNTVRKNKSKTNLCFLFCQISGCVAEGTGSLTASRGSICML